MLQKMNKKKKIESLIYGALWMRADMSSVRYREFSSGYFLYMATQTLK